MKTETTWGSKAAESMFQIATRLAGFEPGELMLEIHRLTHHRGTTRVNEPTVRKAMSIIYERWHGEEMRAKRQEALAEIRANLV